MLAVSLNAWSRPILTASRAALAVFALAIAIGAALALRRGGDASSAERPAFVRRPDPLPTIVVAAPAKTVAQDAAGR